MSNNDNFQGKWCEMKMRITFPEVVDNKLTGMPPHASMPALKKVQSFHNTFPRLRKVLQGVSVVVDKGQPFQPISWWLN